MNNNFRPRGELFTDIFTDADNTSILSHTANTGQAWVRQAGFAGITNDAQIFNNKLYAPQSSVYRANFIMPSPNYEVEADISVVTNVGLMGVTARASNTQRTYYSWTYRDVGQWTLSKQINGTGTTLVTHTQAIGTGNMVRAKLVCRGSTLEGWINGDLKVSWEDTSITNAGSPGLNPVWGVTETTGFRIDNMVARLV